jgi:hypothetical protein
MVDAETTPARPWRTLRWPVYPSALGLVMIAVAFVMAAAAASSRRNEFSLLVGVVGIFWVAASLSWLVVALFVVRRRAQR